jgi:hypothetical protein
VRPGGLTVVILYDEVYMTDEEWVRLLLGVLRSLASEQSDASDYILPPGRGGYGAA